MLNQILKCMPATNTTQKTTVVFVVWFCQCTHSSLSHIRELARHTEKYDYRVAQLSDAERAELKEV